MRRALVLVGLVTLLGCKNSTNEEALKLMRYNAAKQELTEMEQKLSQYESLGNHITTQTEAVQKESAEDIAFYKDEIVRLKKIINDNRP